MTGTVDADFVPMVRPDVLRRDLGAETVLWSPIRAAPAALDPVATVLLGVIDGVASVSELARDVADVVGIAPDDARTRVLEVVEQLDVAGALESSIPVPGKVERLDLFINPPSSCMEASSCTGAVVPVSLELDGRRLRVAFTSRRLARRLRAELADHVIDEPAPLGFMIRSPRRQPRRHELVDRCGFSLGTATGSTRALAMLERHLAALLPSAAGRVRLRIRAVVGESGAVLCAWPLLFAPPLGETDPRRYMLVDRLAVDVDVSSGVMHNGMPPWPTGALESSRHGRSGGLEPVAISRVLLAAPRGTPRPSAAQLVAALASEAMEGGREEILDAVTLIAQRSEVRTVDIDEPRALVDALA